MQPVQPAPNSAGKITPSGVGGVAVPNAMKFGIGAGVVMPDRSRSQLPPMTGALLAAKARPSHPMPKEVLSAQATGELTTTTQPGLVGMKSKVVSLVPLGPGPTNSSNHVASEVVTEPELKSDDAGTGLPS